MSSARSILPMLGTYALGVLNDNFIKQAALLLAIAANAKGFQGTATMAFAAPFLLFSAWCGWAADRFPRRTIVIVSKVLEVVAAGIGVAGLLFDNYGLVLAGIFAMAAQSTLFSPAINATIAAVCPAASINRVNGLFRTVTTVFILLGIGLAGLLLDAGGVKLVAAVALGVAVVGVALSLLVPATPVAGRPSFPRSGPLASLVDTWRVRRDAPLLYALICDAFFYFIATLGLLAVNAFGMLDLGLSAGATSMLAASMTVGICLGALIASRTTRPGRWLKAPAVAGAGLALGLAAAGFAGELASAVAAFSLAGVFGGFLVVPASAFIQHRPADGVKGRVIAVSNFTSFAGILLAGQVYVALELAFAPHTILLCLGGICVLFAALTMFFALRLGRQGIDESEHPDPFLPGTAQELRAAKLLKSWPTLDPAILKDMPEQKRLREKWLLRLALRLLGLALSLRYRVRVRWLTPRPQGPVLILPNHPALIDPVLMMTVCHDYLPRPVADKAQVEHPLTGLLVRAAGAISLPDVVRDGAGADAVRQVVTAAKTALLSGESVLLYPSGRMQRTEAERLGAASMGFELAKTASEFGGAVVLARTSGLWGSRFSHALGTPDQARLLPRFLLALLASGLFFLPRRTVTVELAWREGFPGEPGTGGPGPEEKLAFNRELETFYASRPAEDQGIVPLHVLGKREPVPGASAPAKADSQTGADVVLDDAQAMFVYAWLAQRTSATSVTGETLLGADLGLDSLELTSLSLDFEDAFGRPVDPASLVTAGDLALAASGSGREAAAPAPSPSADWARPLPTPRLDGETVGAAFLAAARRSGNLPVVADAGGEKGYARLLAGIHLVRGLLPKEQRHVGIMLPAGPGAVVAYFAVLLAGKVPVMLNFTAGRAALAHAVELTGIRTVLTAGPIHTRVARAGALPTGPSYIALDALKPSLLKKIWAMLAPRLPGWARHMRRVKASDVAVVLFTSGSEGLPKAVPLTHANLMANLGDIASALSVDGRDSLLAFLPPFHSLGLTANLLLPLTFGLRAAYAPDPTDAGTLASLAKAYRTTLVAATPTFLHGILERAGNLSDVPSMEHHGATGIVHGAQGGLPDMRLAFVGAEACPGRTFELFAKVCPQGEILEGYGTTECSPVVSVNRPSLNRPGRNVRGSLGEPLASIKTRLLHPQTGEPVADGVDGLLLVSGPSVFSGYLGRGQDGFREVDGAWWYETGDIVARKDGVLFFRGRIKRFIKIAGEMISLTAVEQALTDWTSSLPGTEPGAALAMLDMDGLVVVTNTAMPMISVEEANRALRQAGLPPLAKVRDIVRIEEIPLLGSGKTDYPTLQKKVAREIEEMADI